MPSPIQFCVIDDDGSRLGKLKVPHRKVADWINFLVSPRQQVHILSAENHRGSVTLYFQANESLYTYLDKTLKNRETAANESEPALENKIAS